MKRTNLLSMLFVSCLVLSVAAAELPPGFRELVAPAEIHEDWQKIMVFGDSISCGYVPHLKQLMKARNVDVYHYWDYVGDKPDKQKLSNIAASQKFAVIVFNNGLHSMHWTRDKVSDKEIYNRTRDIVRAFRKGCPGAKLIWLQVTPYTGDRNAEGRVTSMGDGAEMVLRLNEISAKVMHDEHVEVIDTYKLLSTHLDWAAGDHYHWHVPAYQAIAKEVDDAVARYQKAMFLAIRKPCLGKKKK